MSEGLREDWDLSLPAARVKVDQEEGEPKEWTTVDRREDHTQRGGRNRIASMKWESSNMFFAWFSPIK